MTGWSEPYDADEDIVWSDPWRELNEPERFATDDDPLARPLDTTVDWPDPFEDDWREPYRRPA